MRRSLVWHTILTMREMQASRVLLARMPEKALEITQVRLLFSPQLRVTDIVPHSVDHSAENRTRSP